MSKKSYGILKKILAVLLLLVGVLVLLSMAVQLYAGALSTSPGWQTWIGAILIIIMALGIGVPAIWGGYYLLKSEGKSDISSERKGMPRPLRIALAILCFLVAIIVFFNVFNIHGYKIPDAASESVIGFWVSQLIMVVTDFFLIRAGIRLLKTPKEKIELLGEEF